MACNILTFPWQQLWNHISRTALCRRTLWEGTKAAFLMVWFCIRDVIFCLHYKRASLALCARCWQRKINMSRSPIYHARYIGSIHLSTMESILSLWSPGSSYTAAPQAGVPSIYFRSLSSSKSLDKVRALERNGIDGLEEKWGASWTAARRLSGLGLPKEEPPSCKDCLVEERAVVPISLRFSVSLAMLLTCRVKCVSLTPMKGFWGVPRRFHEHVCIPVITLLIIKWDLVLNKCT